MSVLSCQSFNCIHIKLHLFSAFSTGDQDLLDAIGPE